MKNLRESLQRLLSGARDVLHRLGYTPSAPRDAMDIQYRPFSQLRSTGCSACPPTGEFARQVHVELCECSTPRLPGARSSPLSGLLQTRRDTRRLGPREGGRGDADGAGGEPGGNPITPGMGRKRPATYGRMFLGCWPLSVHTRKTSDPVIHRFCSCNGPMSSVLT